jgi:hypothetical protein
VHLRRPRRDDHAARPNGRYRPSRPVDILWSRSPRSRVTTSLVPSRPAAVSSVAPRIVGLVAHELKTPVAIIRA